MKPPVGDRYIFGNRHPRLVMLERLGNDALRLFSTSPNKLNDEQRHIRLSRRAAFAAAAGFESLIIEQLEQAKFFGMWRAGFDGINQGLVIEASLSLGEIAERLSRWHLAVGNKRTSRVAEFEVTLDRAPIAKGKRREIHIIERSLARGIRKYSDQDYSEAERVQLYESVAQSFTLLSGAVISGVATETIN